LKTYEIEPASIFSFIPLLEHTHTPNFKNDIL